MRRLTATVTLMTASALLLAGCSSSGKSSTATATTSSTAAAADTIVIKNFAFTPATLTVAPGTKITVTNEDSVAHTVTSTASPQAFDTGDIGAGSSTTFTAPSKAGSYSYICTIHTFMHGSLTVS
jgi:plastocyanin